MFNFMKKGVEKDEKEKRKKEKEGKKKRERGSMTTEELLRLDEVRRSLKIRGRRKEKEKLPSGITADYSENFFAELERDPQFNRTGSLPGHTLSKGSPSNRGEISTHSDSSETSLNSLNASQAPQKSLPPLPPRPPKRGILKGYKTNVTTNEYYENHDPNSTSLLVRNTLQNEVITYQNVQPKNSNNIQKNHQFNNDQNVYSSPEHSASHSQSGSNYLTPVNDKNHLLGITSTSPSAESLTDTTNSSFATPPFSLSPVGESQGFTKIHSSIDDKNIDAPLPDIIPIQLPKVRELTIYRTPRGDFGFQLRRAIITDKLSNVNKKTVIFAEPGAIISNRNDTGLLPGDVLQDVNGIEVHDKSREEIIDLIKGSGSSVTVKVQPIPELCELTRRSGSNGQDIVLDDSNIRGGTLKRSGSQRFKKTTIMNNPLKFSHKFNPSLKHMAAFAYAVSFWENPRTRLKLATYFNSFKYSDKKSSWMKWNEVVLEIVKKIEEILEPHIIADYVVDIAISIGHSIFSWNRYIKKLFSFTFTSKIFWNCYGTIDQQKTVALFLKENGNLITTKSTSVSVFYIASACLLPKYINATSDLVVKWIASMDGDFKRQHLYDENIIYYASAVLISMGHQLHLKQSMESRDDAWLKSGIMSEDEKLFLLAVDRGYPVAVKFYWEKMNVVQRNQNLFAVKRCLKSFCAIHITLDNFFRVDNFFEVFVFLFKKMSDKERQEIFEVSSKDILKLFLFSASGHENFMPMFEECKNFLTTSDYLEILEEIASQSLKAFRLKFKLENNFYHGLLKQFWLKIPQDEQVELAKDKATKFLNIEICDTPALVNVMKLLFRAEDFVNIGVITNTPSVKGKQSKLLKVGCKFIKKWIVENNRRMFEKFKNDVFQSEDDQKYFICKDNFLLEDFLGAKKVYYVEILLHWLSDSAKEREKIKSKIFNMEMCELMFMGRCFDELTDYLDWQFNTELERRKIKHHFKSEMCENVYNSWLKFEERHLVKSLCSGYLKWLFESEDEIKEFKKTELVKEDDHFVKLACDEMAYQRDCRWFEEINKFFNFCGVSDYKRQQIKKIVLDKIDWYIYEYGIHYYDSFAIVECVLDWVCETKKQQRNIFKKFMSNASNGAKLCANQFQGNEWGKSSFLRFLNSWVVYLENIDEIIREVMILYNKECWEKKKIQLISHLEDLKSSRNQILGKKKDEGEGTENKEIDEFENEETKKGENEILEECEIEVGAEIEYDGVGESENEGVEKIKCEVIKEINYEIVNKMEKKDEKLHSRVVQEEREEGKEFDEENDAYANLSGDLGGKRNTGCGKDLDQERRKFDGSYEEGDKKAEEFKFETFKELKIEGVQAEYVPSNKSGNIDTEVGYEPVEKIRRRDLGVKSELVEQMEIEEVKLEIMEGMEIEIGAEIEYEAVEELENDSVEVLRNQKIEELGNGKVNEEGDKKVQEKIFRVEEEEDGDKFEEEDEDEGSEKEEDEDQGLLGEEEDEEQGPEEREEEEDQGLEEEEDEEVGEDRYDSFCDSNDEHYFVPIGGYSERVDSEEESDFGEIWNGDEDYDSDYAF